MKTFSVHDPELDPVAPYFLEASAGTGKTYSIQHLVGRMVDKGIPMERILVVTFTRAAARELKRRLKATDESKIFTIHAFCLEMLRQHPCESGVALDVGGLDLGLSWADQVQVAKDFFRTGLEGYTGEEVRKVLGMARGDPDRLARLILREMGTPVEEAVAPACRWTGKEICEDFERLWPHYLGLATRQGELKEGVRERVSREAEMMEKGELSFVGDPVLLDLVACGKQKARSDVREPEWLAWVREEWGSEYEKVRGQLLARMGADCQVLLERKMEEEGKLTFDGILHKMHAALESKSFVEGVRSQFDAAIVDEFQDTDPVQWEIFDRLFGRDFPLVLVGDPKQSIYAFRGADVYSYMRARDRLGEERRYSLGVNYRSRPALVAALNRLFEGTRDLISLPKLGKTLPFEPVEAGVEEDNPLSLTGAVQRFPVGREEEAFAFICREIAALQLEHGLPYSHFCVLIADRYQAQRLQTFASQRGISCSAMRGRLVSDSPAFAEMRHLLDAVCDPSDRGKVRLFQAGRLGVWSEEVAVILRELHGVLVERGFLPFFETFLERMGVAERLLAESGGEEFYLELRQIAGLLADQDHLDLDALVASGQEDESAPRLFPQSDESQVQLMTTFASKGLEFGVVFALGLAFGKGELNAEREAEAMRLLYVALTRAKDRVYLPHPEGKGISPAHLFFARFEGELPPVAEMGEELKREGVAPPALVPPAPVAISPSGRRLTSYTQLAKPHKKAPLAIGEDEMPAGAQTGVVIHALLEERGRSVEAYCRGTVLEGWEEKVQEIVDGCWKADLGGFCLADVTRLEAEIEFLQGDVGGVIDLFFEFDGKFYLLDWKTNWLPSYAEEEMRAEMEASDYTLQARLYSQAVESYLALYNERLSGVYYVFVRGVPQGEGVLKL